MPKEHRLEYRDELLVQIVGERLREAREVAGLNPDALAREVGVSRSQIYNYENGHRGAQRARDSVLRDLAAQLGVKEGWLRGDDAIPIDLHGWRFPPELGEDIAARLGPGRSSLRRWKFVGRCIRAARRDYKQGPGLDDDWRRIEWHLVARFLLLPTVGSLALRLVAAPPPNGVIGSAVPPTGEETSLWKWWQEWNEAAVAFWERFLEPWFAGDMGLNYRVLAPLLDEGEWPPFGHSGSPRDILSPTVRKQKHNRRRTRAREGM